MNGAVSRARIMGDLPGEKRRGRRDRVLLSGKVVLESGLTHDCAIDDLSPEGARLKVGPFVALPDDFHLIVLVGGVAHRCEVRWRTPPWIGVRFAHSSDLRSAGGVAPYHVRRIWLDR